MSKRQGCLLVICRVLFLSSPCVAGDLKQHCWLAQPLSISPTILFCHRTQVADPQKQGSTTTRFFFLLVCSSTPGSHKRPSASRLTLHPKMPNDHELNCYSSTLRPQPGLRYGAANVSLLDPVPAGGPKDLALPNCCRIAVGSGGAR